MTITFQQFSAAAFAPHVGERFLFRDASDLALELTLASVEGAGGTPPAGVRPDPFSLMFSGPARTPFVQGMLRLDHPDFEPCDLFLVRIMPPAGVTGGSAGWFQAVFG